MRLQETLLLERRGMALRHTIASEFWSRLTRTMTRERAADVAYDSKAPQSSDVPVIFLSQLQKGSDSERYYAEDDSLEIRFLPPLSKINDDVVYNISHEPGVLALAFKDGKPLNYLVPGGRFNEFFGWDSYFIARGLIQDELTEAAASIATHFAYEIENYGRVLNANRPYFLGRSQPPFLTDLAWQLIEHHPTDFVTWINAAIHEYHGVWMSRDHLDKLTGLSKYAAMGRGIPPEVEKGHFDNVLRPYAEKHGLTISEFSDKYNAEEIKEPALDEYFRHDSALRESGHDVTSRFVGVCADLVTVDLNSLLYKYEKDIARAVATYPSDFPNEDAAEWNKRADRRRAAVHKYLWNEKDGFFCDYNVKLGSQHKPLVSATTLWPLWTYLATPEQAQRIVNGALKKLDMPGGLSSTSEIESAVWQWDYPEAWAPHQLLAWEGLENYDFHEQAASLALKWLSTVSQGFNRSGGAVYEKYDVRGVEDPQNVKVEYGNQGNKDTGFGWTNAVFAIGWDRYVK